MIDDQVQIAFAILLSLEEEKNRKAIPSEEEIRAEAQERLHRERPRR